MSNAFAVSQINELQPAIKESILHIDLSTSPKKILNYNLDVNKITLDYLCHIDELLKNGNYLILDDILSSSLTKKALDTKSPTGKRIKHMELMRDIMSKLPCFNDLSIKSILEIRSDLSQYLIPFRGAIQTYANEIKSAPWTEEFQYECEENFIKNIKPAIYEIENQYKHNRNYTDMILKSIGEIPSAEIGIFFAAPPILSSFTDYSTLIVGAFTGAGAVATALVPKLAKRLNEYRTVEKTIQDNPLFFYYKAESLIQNRHK